CVAAASERDVERRDQAGAGQECRKEPRRPLAQQGRADPVPCADRGDPHGYGSVPLLNAERPPQGWPFMTARVMTVSAKPSMLQPRLRSSCMRASWRSSSEG